MWPLLLLAIVLVFIRFGAERLRDELGSRVEQSVLGRRFSMRAKGRNDRQLLRDLRAIDPPEFEHYIAALFSTLGYRTTVVGGPNDGGIDVIAVKDGIEHYIQCKKHITSAVGVEAIRAFYGVIADRLTQGTGYFITTNDFTLEARRWAADKPIELVDGYKWVRYIRMAEAAPGAPLARPTPHTPEVEIAPGICPLCESQLRLIHGKFGPFVGCTDYPGCGYKRNVPAEKTTSV